MNQIISQLKKSNHVLLATHINPDGDAIGSLIALGLALNALNKKTTLYNESPIPVAYHFLPWVNHIERHIDGVSSFDTAIILDCSELKRIGKAGLTVSRIPVIINIDHHITNTGFGDFQLVDTFACATAQILYRLLRRMDISISRDMAVSIYTGILTDTGSFRFSNTNRAAFEISGEMVRLGVDPYHVAQHLFGRYSFGRTKLLNLALDSIEITDNGKFSLMTLTKEMFEATGTQAEDSEGFIDYAGSIKNVKVAAFIKEEDNFKGASQQNRFHVSLRSDGTVDVAKIAVSFGGGGHFSASGFDIEATLPDVKNKIFSLAGKL